MSLKAICAAAAVLAVGMVPAWASDPVILHDAATGVVITQSVVAAMVKADTEAAGLFGLPKPGADAEAQLIAALKADFARTDPEIKRMMGRAARDLPLGLPYLQTNTPETRAHFIAGMKPQIMKAATPGSRLLNLTEVLVGLGERGAANGMGASGSALGNNARMFGMIQSQQMTNHWMQQGMRSAYTSCNTYNGSMQRNWSFCHP